MFGAGIVVGGEALIDVVHHPGRPPEAHPGGGPYNTARTLGRLGRDVAYLGLLSRDAEGARLREGLAADGVETSPQLDTDLPTTQSEATLDAEGTASYRFTSAGTSAAALTPEAALAALGTASAARVLHVGSLGLVFEPTAGALRAVTERLARGALVMVDVNCRPSAIDDADGYRAGLEAVLGHAHVVKASTEDLAWLAPDRDPIDAARALLDLGPRVALVTDGPRGARIVSEGDCTHVGAPAVDLVADTVGAGDAFGGAFLAWWDSRGLGAGDLGEVEHLNAGTHFACLVAARTCERPGAWPPTLAELGAAAL